MLPGDRAFAGEDVSDTLAEVMKVEPAWTKLPDAVPPVLVTFLKRCLRKNAAERMRDIGDIRLALEGAFDTIVTTVTTATSPAAAPAPRPMWRRALRFAATLLVPAVAAAAGWFLKPAGSQPVVKATHVLPSGRNFRITGTPVLAVSPDGRQIVYNGTGGLYVRSLDAFGDRLIPGTEGGSAFPVFSPDGQSLAFFQDGGIRRIAPTGGASVPLATNIDSYGISWEADGSILYTSRGAVWQVAENGGEPRMLIDAPKAEAYALPQRLPGGDWILLSTLVDPQTAGDVVAVLPATGERRTLRKGAGGGRYVPSGHLLYMDGGVMYAVPFDAKQVVVTGGPVPVLEGVRRAVGSFNVPQLAVSPTGTLAYLSGPVGASRNRLSPAITDRGGNVTPINTQPGPYTLVRATRDGTRLALDSDDGKEAIVWIYEMGGTAAMRRLTFGGRNRFPVWSPDGRRVAFQSDREGDAAIYVQNADGTGTVERLTRPENGDAHVPESWSPNGHLSFSLVSKGLIFSLWTYSFDARKATQFSATRSREPFGSAFSPDGKWITYHVLPEVTAALASSAGVFVAAFPPTNAPYQAPRVSRDFQPVWSNGGRELIYIPSVSSGRMAAVSFRTAPSVAFGTPATFPFVLNAGSLSNGWRAFDVLPNGNIVSLSSDSDSAQAGAAPTEIRVVVNWLEELRRLAPRP
jgi:serine/threonine-protein kinase